MSEVMRQAEPEATREVARQQGDRETLWPPADVFEGKDGITLLLDMPGVSRDRLDVTVDGNRLLVEGDMEISMHETMESLHADIHATHFSRAFSLSGEQLDTGNINAVLNDGVVRIDIPKKAELQPRKVEVKAD